MTYDFPTAFSSWSDGDGGTESAAIYRVLRSGRFTMAGEVEAFEAEFAAYHGRRHGIMVNSGSSANLVAVAALQGSSPHVARVPAIAWATTYAPLVQYDYDLLLYDVDDTWNVPYNLDYIKGGIVITCPILGNPAYSFDTFDETYRIEDCCESLGARTETGQLVGTFGHLSTFSFFYSHQLSAIEGGMVLTDDDVLANLCRMIRAHGWTRDVAKPERFEDEYNFRVMGYNVRPLEMHAAIAREQLKKLDGFIEVRIKNLAAFKNLTAGLPIVHQRTVGRPSPFGLAFTVESPEVRSRLATALRAASIDCRLPTGGSFRRHPYAARWADQQTPVADRIHDTGIFLGNAPWNIAPLIERAVKVMRATL